MTVADARELLLITGLVTIGYQLSFFAIAATFKFDKVTDLAGGSNFLINAVLGLILTGKYQIPQIVGTIMVSIWAVRLAGYLFYRILKIGEDKRFDDKRGNFFAFLAFWIIQIVWVWCVGMPINVVNAATETLSDLTETTAIAGIAMWALGLTIETLADAQKFTFKNDEKNKGKWCDVGVWSWSRHPNYFGEILHWWGVWTFASTFFTEMGVSWGWATLIASPGLTTLLLLFVSGVPLLEKSANEKYGTMIEYMKYKDCTSILVPVPPALCSRLPRIIKYILLMESPLFETKESEKTD